VLEQLIKRDYEFLFLDELEYPSGISLYQEWDIDNYSKGYLKSHDGTCVDLEKLTGVYIRFADFQFTEFLKNFHEWEKEIIKAERNFSQSFIFDDLECAVVNRLSSQMSNACKPLQTAIAARYGFPTPRTVITSDPVYAQEFIKECDGSVIYKAMGGTRTIVERVNLNDLKRLDEVRICPVMFQEFVPGVNVRVHVVDKVVFATRVYASSVDYRYSPTRFEPMKLPQAVEDACVKITSDLDLLMSGIDLIESEGQYWFLEANPSPGFSFYEVNAKQPISAALITLLKNGTCE
jgi:glutathione synthase/RimK-type ligase-like ATP-grasp enzyme